MKHLILAVVFLLFLNLLSYSQSGFTLSFGAGIVAPTGVLSEDNITGFNAHGNAGYLFNSNMGARMDLQYNSFSPDSRKFPNSYGGRLSIVSIKGDILAGNFNRFDRINPYGVAGIGYYMSSRSDMTINGITYMFPSSNDLGMGLGGGIIYNISPKTSLYGEVQYNNIFASDNITFIPLRAGIIIRP